MLDLVQQITAPEDRTGYSGSAAAQVNKVGGHNDQRRPVTRRNRQSTTGTTDSSTNEIKGIRRYNDPSAEDELDTRRAATGGLLVPAEGDNDGGSVKLAAPADLDGVRTDHSSRRSILPPEREGEGNHEKNGGDLLARPDIFTTDERPVIDTTRLRQDRPAAAVGAAAGSTYHSSRTRLAYTLLAGS